MQVLVNKRMSNIDHVPCAPVVSPPKKKTKTEYVSIPTAVRLYKQICQVNNMVY